MRITRLALLVAAALAAGGATMLVARAGTNGAATATATTIHACAKVHGGKLRAVDAAVPCRHDERSLEWNVQGPRATPASPGLPVPPVPSARPGRQDQPAPQVRREQPGRRVPWARPGPQGPPGAGLASLEGLNGLACHAGGQTGTVSLAYDAAGHASLTCTTVAEAVAERPRSSSTSSRPASRAQPRTSSSSSTTRAHRRSTSAGSRSSIARRPGTSDSTLATIPAGTQLAAGAFYLLGGSGYAGSAPADQSFGLSPAATGGSLAVRDASGTLLDAVAYGTAANGLGRGPARDRAADDGRPGHQRDQAAGRPRHVRQRRGLPRYRLSDAERCECRRLTEVCIRVRGPQGSDPRFRLSLRAPPARPPPGRCSPRADECRRVGASSSHRAGSSAGRRPSRRRLSQRSTVSAASTG